MSNMTTKPDFAQKLLNDLRQRKERMAATQHSSRQSSQTSRGEHFSSPMQQNIACHFSCIFSDLTLRNTSCMTRFRGFGSNR